MNSEVLEKSLGELDTVEALPQREHARQLLGHGSAHVLTNLDAGALLLHIVQALAQHLHRIAAGPHYGIGRRDWRGRRRR